MTAADQIALVAVIIGGANTLLLGLSFWVTYSTSQKVQDVKVTVDTVKVQTDGLKDALVAEQKKRVTAVAESSEAKGVIQGRAEVTKEVADQKTSS